MKKTKKLVSIIIRVKNEKWITSCLRSVFNQQYNHLIIIVNNQSNDNTLKNIKILD